MSLESLSKPSNEISNLSLDDGNNRDCEEMPYDPDSRIDPLTNSLEDIESSDEFDPDKKIDVKSDEIVHDDHDEAEYDADDCIEINDSEKESAEGDGVDNKNDSNDEYLTTRGERLKCVPIESSDRGKFTGEYGDSKYIPSETTEKGKDAIEKLNEFGVDGIEYKNGIPDFSKCSVETVEIDAMTENRYPYIDKNGNSQLGNFKQADIKCAENWNAISKDGKNDWTARDIEAYRKDNQLSWHERCDMKTCDLVPREIHEYFGHSGGCAECRKRDHEGAENLGGGFDE